MQPHTHASTRARLLIAASVATLATGCLWQKESPDLKDKDVRLTILHTSDIHSRLLPYDLAPLKTDRDLGLIPEAAPFGGAARLAALIKRERAKSERAIHVDSGDCFQGAPLFNVNNGEAELKFMSLLRPEAVVIGNHEFDAGAMNFARQASQFAAYPLLAANYDYSRPDLDDPTEGLLGRVSQPYTIINADGLRVAVIGMANLGSLNSIVEGGNSLGVTPLEQNEVLRGWIETLAPQVDLIGVTSHLGLTEDQDLVLGYEAVYWENDIRPFLERTKDRWEIIKDFGDGRVEVHIPGVRGLDFIMGGHLHVVLNPPQVLVDRDGRKVVLSHSGAFAKYLGRLDLVVRNGEIQSHTYKAFPIDSLWCLEPEERENRPEFTSSEWIEDLLARNKTRCAEQEDAETLKLLDFYRLEMGQVFDLPMIFGYAPRNVERRNSSGGGDSPLGNLTAQSMRKRRGVEAEFAITNTLGIRDNLYAGPVTLEGMFNIFPFENTLTVMYLSGAEVQEVMNFMAERSAGRGCQSQGQIDGASFVMDCGRANENERLRIDPNPEVRCQTTSQCVDRALASGASQSEASAWQCHLGDCYRHPAHGIVINGEPLNPTASYKVAVNDYIAKGGSGFDVLKRNTTRFDTGISLRDALIESMRQFCTCDDLEKTDEETVARCAQLFGGLSPEQTSADGPAQCRNVKLPTSCQTAHDYCATARQYEDKLAELEAAGPLDFAAAQALGETANIYAGKCSCHEVLFTAHGPAGGSAEAQAVRTRCGHVTDALENFCHGPRAYPVISTEEDGRIVRRVK